MNAIITADTMNVFSDRCNHLKGKPLAHYSKMLLTVAWKHYTTTEKELSAIVMTLKNYKKMLRGSKIFMCTDHSKIQIFPVQYIL